MIPISMAFIMLRMKESCSWYEFARAIFEEVGTTEVEVKPCATDQFPRPAPRPPYSVLDNEALKKAGFEPLRQRQWRVALHHFLVSGFDNEAGAPTFSPGTQNVIRLEKERPSHNKPITFKEAHNNGEKQ